MHTAPACVLLVPGDLHTPTGGYVYDRRLAESLRARGWAVSVLRIDGTWPWPGDATLAEARQRIAGLPDGCCVVADGLAFGVLDDVVAPHANRLRWVALVHHPLHLETGLDAQRAQTLRERETKALAFAQRVIVTSPSTVADVAALGVPRERIAVVEPGTDAIAPGAPGPMAARSGNGVQLLCVATLTPRKNHAGLLHALAGLTDLDWTLHCVGSTTRDAALAQRLQASTVTGPLAGRVHWHGELVDAALAARYAAADVFVLASRHEGFGMVINEALQHGLPVVASRAGALAQTVPPQAGMLVPATDTAAWREALATVIVDGGLRERLAAGARAAALRLPSWAGQAARFAAAITQPGEATA
ncbi:MAG: glycosyltransferase family 4 protein [Hydrogenophaga sp.]|nr:glycosyltransferase family 4 protein [Hydrogenophaga sp.]